MTSNIKWAWNPDYQLYYYWDLAANECVWSDDRRDPWALGNGQPTPASPWRDQALAPGYPSSPRGPPGYGHEPSHRLPNDPPRFSPSGLHSASSIPHMAPSFTSSLTRGRRSNLSDPVSQRPTVPGSSALSLSGTAQEIKPPSNLDTLMTSRMPVRRGSENLEDRYKLKRPGFFMPGRVFLVLWAEPAGKAGRFSDTSSNTGSAISTGSFHEPIFSKIRRFIVVRAGKTYCNAVPILTYERQGTSKTGVNKSEHAIVYTGDHAPLPDKGELPLRGELGMRPIPIRVKPDNAHEALDPMSRINYGKVHTIEYNIKVRPFGIVHPKSQHALLAQFMNVMTGTASENPPPSGGMLVPASIDRDTVAGEDERHRPAAVTTSASPSGVDSDGSE